MWEEVPLGDLRGTEARDALMLALWYFLDTSLDMCPNCEGPWDLCDC